MVTMLNSKLKSEYVVSLYVNYVLYCFSLAFQISHLLVSGEVIGCRHMKSK
jgi:hypothetical protein